MLCPPEIPGSSGVPLHTEGAGDARAGLSTGGMLCSPLLMLCSPNLLMLLWKAGCACGEENPCQPRRALGLLQCQGGALCYHCGILEAEALREIPLIPGHEISLYTLAVLLILNSALLPRAGN